MNIGVFGNDRFLTGIISVIIAEDNHSIFLSRYWSVFEAQAKNQTFSTLIFLCEHSAKCSFKSMRCQNLSNLLRIPSILIHKNANNFPNLGQKDSLILHVNNPFYPEELLNLVRQIAKPGSEQSERSENFANPSNRFGCDAHWLQDFELAPNLYYNHSEHYVLRSGLKVYLSPRESRMLDILVQNAGKIVPFDVLFQAIWKADESGSFDSLYTVVRSLKKKLYWRDGEKAIDLIQNIYGEGYLLKFPTTSNESCICAM